MTGEDGDKAEPPCKGWLVRVTDGICVINVQVSLPVVSFQANRSSALANVAGLSAVPYVLIFTQDFITLLGSRV